VIIAEQCRTAQPCQAFPLFLEKGAVMRTIMSSS
jgi:hypothetical protein